MSRHRSSSEEVVRFHVHDTIHWDTDRCVVQSGSSGETTATIDTVELNVRDRSVQRIEGWVLVCTEQHCMIQEISLRTSQRHQQCL